MLPINWLLKRLANEEERLKQSFPNIKVERKDLVGEFSSTGRLVKIPVPIGIEEVEAVRIYKINGLDAAGFVKEGNSVKKLGIHSFEIYILRSYPFGLYTMKTIKKQTFYDAPIRIKHLSNIYHPNIMPGPAYIDDEYAGAVCWAVYGNWLQTMTLEKIVEGYKLLIENPNPDPREALNRPICKEAATYFSGGLMSPVFPSSPVLEKRAEPIGRRKPSVVGVG